jgi:cellulose synthase/poly-beta-1,6-N-acetylglucosamine synthase-like glycosyltransferase
MLAAWLFWIAFALVFYVYVGYFASVLALAPLFRRDVVKGEPSVGVSIVIAAYNEAEEIERTVLNKLAQDYPHDRLDVVVVSDGSTDETDAIVQRIIAEGAGRLRLVRQEPRQGKTAALNLAMRGVTAEIAVFSDANSLYAPDAVRKLVRSFADPSVGYVTGQMVYVNPENSGIGEGSGNYMSYENRLRAAETCLGSIVGVDGGIDAVRSSCYVPMQPDQLPDFVLPLNVVEQGMRVVYEPDARVYEAALATPGAEFRMRVRVSLRALWALHDKRNLLNPLRFPLFSWQLLSHKVLRYLAFVPLALLLLSSFWLAGSHPFYLSFLLLQLLMYVIAAAGHWFRQASADKSRLLVPYYFVLLNAACMFAFWKYVRGEKMVLWKPRAGGT